MRFAAIFFLYCASVFAQSGGVAGIVLDSTTQQPVPGVHITLIGLPAENAPMEDIYGALSKNDGRYSIGNMKPGVYAVTVRRNGMVQVPPRGVEPAEAYRVLVKAGETAEFPLEVSPHAVITGRVTDEFGEPVRSVQMQAIPVKQGNMAARGNMYSGTDDRGVFRLALVPGRYRLKATVNRQGQMGVVTEIRTDGTQPAVYAPTWYPASTSEERGDIVEAAAGRELSGVDISLLQQNSHRVSGTITGLPDKTTRVTMYLFPATEDMQTQFLGLRTAISAQDGTFGFGGVPAGTYRVTAMMVGNMSAAPPMRGIAGDIRVDSADVTDVRVNLMPGEEITGSLEMVGSGAAGKPDEKPLVILEPFSQMDRSFGSPMVSGEVDKQGAFRLTGVFPGRFRLRVDPLPENAYVKSVKVDGNETADLIVDLTRGVGNSALKITVGRNGGQLDGTLLSKDGKPLGATSALIALVASPEDIAFDKLKRANGASFTFKGIRPGKYRIISADAFQVQDALTELKALFARAPEIEIKEGDRLKREVPLLSREKPGAN